MKNSPHYQFLRSEADKDFTLFKIRSDFYINKRNDIPFRATVVESKDAANVIALTDNREIVMVRQYRFGICEPTIEIPGGLIEAGEDPQTGCARELLEETGFAATNWQSLGKIPSNPVFIDSYIHHFLASDARQVSNTLTEDIGENIEVVLIPVEQVKTMIRRHEIVHPHTLTALMRYFWEGVG